jgi:hypothetical protein
MLATSSLPLIVQTTADDSAVNGDAYRLRDNGLGDGISAQEQTFLIVFELTATGGSSPTVDADLETSWDGSTWHTLSSMTQLSGAGTKLEVKTVAYVGRYVRATITPGGTTAPEVTGTIRLASSGPIRVAS